MKVGSDQDMIIDFIADYQFAAGHTTNSRLNVTMYSEFFQGYVNAGVAALYSSIARYLNMLLYAVSSNVVLQFWFDHKKHWAAINQLFTY